MPNLPDFKLLIPRYRFLVTGGAGFIGSHLAGFLLMGFGLVSFTVAGLFLHRQRDIKKKVKSFGKCTGSGRLELLLRLGPGPALIGIAGFDGCVAALYSRAPRLRPPVSARH